MNERCKEIRLLKKLTQKEFAEAIGLSRNYIAVVEMGQREPSDRTIKDICRVFGVNEAWLRDGIGEPFAAQSREVEMAALFKNLMSDRPDSFRARLITALLRFEPDSPEWALLRFEPDSPEWALLENIYNSVAADIKNEREP